MKPRSLSLAVKGSGDQDDDCGPLLSGALEDVVRLDESMWTVASDEHSTQVRGESEGRGVRRCRRVVVVVGRCTITF